MNSAFVGKNSFALGSYPTGSELLQRTLQGFPSQCNLMYSNAMADGLQKNKFAGLQRLIL